MQIITQPDGEKVVIENNIKIAYIDEGRLYMVGQGTQLGDDNLSNSEIIQEIKNWRKKCKL